MRATLYLLGCVLASAQPLPKPTPPMALPTRASEWQLTPRLSRAQELVYRGTYTEESRINGVQFSRAYRLETRVFVLDAQARGTEIALLTSLKARDPRATIQNAGSAVRLEKALLDGTGRLAADPIGSLALALDGPPTIECGMFVEAPDGKISQGQGWETLEVGRPMRLWRVIGAETVNGTSCVKVVVNQQSEDWDRPQLDKAAWRREDTIWISPRTGLAMRVERILDRRDAGRRDPTQRGMLRYDLDSTLQYPGQLFEDRKLEVLQARSFSQTAQPLLATPAKNSSQLAALFTKVSYHLDKQTPTPYREAILQTKGQIEAARRGEVPISTSSGSTTTKVADLGQPAPDFVVPYVTHAGPSFQLHRWFGRPIVLVFYNPASRTAPDLLQFTEKLAADHAQRAAVFGLAVSGNAETIRKQWSELKLTFPVINGSGLRISYAVESTPKIVVVDGAGVVRGAYVGWGSETSREVLTELKNWLPKK